MTVGDLDTLIPLRHDIDVLVPLDDALLEGFLSVPASPAGIVLFAHGSGSGRMSPRNHFVAEEIYRRGIATLLIDLLTPAEEKLEAATRHLRFDIGLLAERLSQIAAWIGRHEKICGLPLGLLGSSTGAAAALMTAARYPDIVRAVVSRGGRPDLAAEALAQVEAPTLLIVGGADRDVLKLNKMAFKQLPDAQLEIVPGATHLFEEPGALEQTARLAAQWFGRYLPC